MTDYAGKTVFHKSKYGNGIIVSQDEKGYIYVKFDNEIDLKRFSAPSCFKSFLKLYDDEAAEKAIEDNREKDEYERNIKKIKQQETTARALFNNSQSKKVTGKENVLDNPVYNSLDDYIENQEKALKSEIAYLSNNGGKRIKIFDGKFIEIKSGGYIYSFESESELNIPDNTPISLWLGNSIECIKGFIVDCEEFVVVLTIAKSIGNTVPVCEFSPDSWKLIRSLNERLYYIKQNPSKIVNDLVCEGRKKIVFGGEINKGQATACSMSASNPITFIWGPPGTGKTETLASIALQHIKQGNRVLMVSYSNVSVDGAVWRIFNKASDFKEGMIVRYGYPKDKSLLNHEYLSSYNLTLKNNPEMLSERKLLIEERKHLDRTNKRYVEITTRLNEIKEKMTNVEKDTVKNASFVATTVSKAIADKALYQEKFDTVIFDEASMAYTPQIIFAAWLAKKHFVCMGDFSQLPPIVQNSKTNCLNVDIFQFCGITDAVRSGCGHEWLCLLDTQYRMHPDIASFSSRTMYNGLLKTSDGIEERRKSIFEDVPFSGTALQLVDLSGMYSLCTQTADQSRINLLSAFISIGLAIKAAKKHDVGIITPYNAQARLLHAFSKDIESEHSELHKIMCATVHQFQGSEKDVILYDAVDCYRMKFPGVFLASAFNNYSNRLYNVAVTRAKGKMVSIANVNYMKAKKLSSSLIFRTMIEHMGAEGKVTFGYNISSEINNTILPSFSKLGGENAFLNDLSKAKTEIRIDIPHEIESSLSFPRSLSGILDMAQKKGIKVILRTSDILKLPAELKQYTIENKFLSNPIAIIDKRIVWYGMPLSNASFISEGHVIPTRFKPIFRFCGKNTAQAIYILHEMNKTVDSSDRKIDPESPEVYNTFAAYVAGEINCKLCGDGMHLKKNSKGIFYLACSNTQCGNNQYIETEMVEDYFYYKNLNGKRCPQDGFSLVAKYGKYGVYVSCAREKEQAHTYRLDQV